MAESVPVAARRSLTDHLLRFVVFESEDMVERVLNENGKHRVDGKWVDVKRS